MQCRRKRADSCRCLLNHFPRSHLYHFATSSPPPLPLRNLIAILVAVVFLTSDVELAVVAVQRKASECQRHIVTRLARLARDLRNITFNPFNLLVQLVQPVQHPVFVQYVQQSFNLFSNCSTSVQQCSLTKMYILLEKYQSVSSPYAQLAQKTFNHFRPDQMHVCR
jgi:hypothetical protein